VKANKKVRGNESGGKRLGVSRMKIGLLVEYLNLKALSINFLVSGEDSTQLLKGEWE
jgi:hypothetical protein